MRLSYHFSRFTICAGCARVFLANVGPVAAQLKASRNNEQSCRRFVQDFYDWYIRATKDSGYEVALKKRRSAFSPRVCASRKFSFLRASRPLTCG